MYPYVTINVRVADALYAISTEALKEELKKRAELEIDDPEQAANDEIGRCDIEERFEYDIDPDDYDLVPEDEVNDVESISDDDLLEEAKDRGFELMSPFTDSETVEAATRELDNSPRHRQKEFICDMLRISRHSTYEDICLAIKEHV